jgi:dTDP-4-amino-4,6-dideoxygalactose transaminase
MNEFEGLDLEPVLVSPATTLGEALQRLDTTGLAILLLTDADGVLLRTVTDGDLRRLILEGKKMDCPLSRLPNKQPVTSNKDTSVRQLLLRMNNEGVNQIVVVDADMRPLSIKRREDIDNAILLSTPHLGGEELAFVNQAFETNWIAPVGPNIDSFENEIADKVGVKHAVALSSGTAAIHLALIVLGVEPGDTVFCSSFTFVASANPILYQRARPIFIDSEPDTWNMSPSALRAAFIDSGRDSKLPKAVVIVNLYGQSAKYDALSEICREYGVPIVEDAAESLGASYQKKQSGTFGDIGIFSFNGNKIITTSGGGMLVTNNEKYALHAKKLSTQARESVHWYEHIELGYNYRMSNISAGIGRGQIRVLDDRVLARREIFCRYQGLLASNSNIDWMPELSDGVSTRWLSVFTINSGCDIDRVVRQMDKEEIEVRFVWKPLHMQPLFEGCNYYKHDDGESVCENIFAKGLCLPSGSNLTLENQERVADSLLRAIE